MASKYNAEGYYSPTEYEAFTRVEKEERAAKRAADFRPMDIQKEAMYQVTMSIVKKMFHANLISEEEYRQIDTMFREKYEPKIGTLFVDLEPKQR